jgi:formylglycine-generating enzyme required for sulfatase activity
MKRLPVAALLALCALCGFGQQGGGAPGGVPEGFALVEGGTFTMGSPETGEDRYEHEGPQRQVTVRSFYLGKHEVTQGEWRAVMGTTVAAQRDTAQTAVKRSGWDLYGEGENYPVYYVSWFEAVEYCNQRSVKEGLSPAYTIKGDTVTCDWNANGYRLPTEAEWEYAAKGGNKGSAYLYAGSDSPGEVGWYTDNSNGASHEVGKKKANDLGIYDLSGNVWEWLWDWFGDYEDKAQTDPRGPDTGSGRVVHSGSWLHRARDLRPFCRGGSDPSTRAGFYGFRLARSQ